MTVGYGSCHSGVETLVRPESSALVRLGGKSVLVMGLGRFGGGVGVTRWLVAEGARVTVVDQAESSLLQDSIQQLSGLPVKIRCGGHRSDDLDGIELVVVNPAVVKHKSEFFQEIEAQRIPWTTEMNLFCERCPAAVIGVTGSFGKSTTSAMLAEVLMTAVREKAIHYSRVHFGGNIGRSLLPELGEIAKSDIVVLEMSNAQLEDLPRIHWSPELAVITNLRPHHLDRHGSFNAYASAKLNILGDAKSPTVAVVGELPHEAEGWLDEALARSSPDINRGGVCARSASTVLGGSDRTRLLRVADNVDRFRLVVPGEHNQKNAASAWTAARVVGVDDSIIRKGLTGFQGLPHRLQHVRTLDAVDYYNDSKSTSPSATVVALEAFDRPVVLVLGGQRKDVALTDMVPVVLAKSRAVVCMGEAGPVFAQALRAATRRNSVEVFEVQDCATAVNECRRLAQPGDAVLFSPGAPSFDQFVNYTARGDHFVNLVMSFS